MVRALLLLLSCLADYETVRDLVHGAFTAGLASMIALCCFGTAFALRRLRWVRGKWHQESYLIY